MSQIVKSRKRKVAAVPTLGATVNEADAEIQDGGGNTARKGKVLWLMAAAATTITCTGFLCRRLLRS